MKFVFVDGEKICLYQDGKIEKFLTIKGENDIVLYKYLDTVKSRKLN